MKYWNRTLRDMSEYVPGEQPENLDEFVKLNTNENPFPPPQPVLEAIAKQCNGNLRRYPSPTSMPVRRLFAEKHGLTPENVFVANGSDEIFTLLFRGFIEKDGMAAFPYPSYSLYYTMSEANGIPYEKIDLDENLDVRFDAFLEKDYDMIIISNPNNPTGKGVDVNAVASFLKDYRGLLVVDEAYVDFYDETAIDLVKDFDNLVITRSFSKSYSLAGLRVGLAIASRDIINGFLKLKDSYNVDRLAEAGAYAALLEEKGFRYNIQMLRNNKEYLEDALQEMGFHIVPSKANFVFVKHREMESEKVYTRLKEKKILVRYFNGPVQSEYIRITVGTMMEVKKLIKELRTIVEGE